MVREAGGGNRARQLRVDAISPADCVAEVPDCASHRQVLPFLLPRLLRRLLDLCSHGMFVPETATLVSTIGHQALILAAAEFEGSVGHTMP